MRVLAILILTLIFTSCGENFSNNKNHKVLPDDIKELKEDAQTEDEVINPNITAGQQTLVSKPVETKEQGREDNDEWTSPAEHGETDHLYVRKGKHNLTLQWLGWDKPGSVVIDYEGEGIYSIKGSQRTNNGYVEINGSFATVSKKELRFTGKIVTQVSHNNNGEPCIKEGTFTFLSTKNRKYYRLQEMENCEGGRLVDYVDIYF
jgi:hypothetical protein